LFRNSNFKVMKTLDVVDQVEPNIKNSTFNITFKTGARVDFDKLKGKVEDAGFFVANFTVVMNVEKLAISNDTHINVGNDVFHFLNVKDKVVSGDQTIRILDKGFVSAKEFKKNSSLTKMTCYKTGEENLPTGQAGGKRIFHVTI